MKSNRRASGWDGGALARQLDLFPYPVTITDAGQRLVYVNPAFCDVYGWKAEEVLGLPPIVLVPRLEAADWLAQFWTEVVKGDGWRGSVQNVTKSGKRLEVQLRTFAIRHGLLGRALYYLGVSTPRTNLLRVETELMSLLCSDAMRREWDGAHVALPSPTTRQTQIARMRMMGYAVKEIARALNISPATVNVALFRTRRKAARLGKARKN